MGVVWPGVVSACLLPPASMSGKAPPKGPRALLGAHQPSSSSSAAPHHHHQPRPPPTAHTGSSRIGATPPTGPRSLLAAAPRQPPGGPKQLYGGQGASRTPGPAVSAWVPRRRGQITHFAFFFRGAGPRELAGGACVGRGRRCERGRARGLAAAAAVGDAAAAWGAEAGQGVGAYCDTASGRRSSGAAATAAVDDGAVASTAADDAATIAAPATPEPPAVATDW